MSKTSDVPEQLYNGPLVLWMEKMKDKTTLNLSDRNLTARDVEAIGYVLKTNNTLTELNLGRNNITDVESIGDALKTNNTLTTLSLWNNNITDVTSIGEGLKTNNTLETLYLGSNNITDVESIGEALKTNNTLEVLDLYNNQLSDNMKSQLQAIEQYKKVKIYIGRYSNKIKLRF